MIEQIARFVGVGVGGLVVDGDEEWREFVFGGGGGGEDVADLPAFEDQGVGDEGAVAAPGDGFGTHDGGGGSGGDLSEGVEAFGELGSGHVVGVSAKGCVAPAGVGGVFAAVTAAAEVFHVGVVDGCCVEGGCEGFGVELRDVAGFGDGANIDEVTDSVGIEKRDELFDGVSGVADGEEKKRHTVILLLSALLKIQGPDWNFDPDSLICRYGGISCGFDSRCEALVDAGAR